MSDIDIRVEGYAGRITLTRAKALNAVTYEMCLAIEAALDKWREDPGISLVVIDADGEKAFCAGGDIQKLYETGKAGDYEYGRRFWRDEYRLNAKIAQYPKPFVAFMQGFTMGGGVGIGCHGSHRVVCDNSRIAMPECSIGLIPDVGGSLLLARAPGHLGAYLGVTGAHMHAGDAIFAGFADLCIPIENWTACMSALVETGNPAALTDHAETPPEAGLQPMLTRINAHFGGETLIDILASLRAEDSDFAEATLAKLERNSPLSMACTIEILHRLNDGVADIRTALEHEYRFTHRAMEHGDFLEGIRAQVIDKDRQPRWRHGLDDPPMVDAADMLKPLGAAQLTFEPKG